MSEDQQNWMKIESYLEKIEKRINSDTFASDDSVKRSLFGIFSQNYEIYKTQANTGQGLEEIFWSAFKGSKILKDV